MAADSWRRSDGGSRRGGRARAPIALDDAAGKRLVVAYLDRMVQDGYAAWSQLDNGEVQLRTTSGEVFRLGATLITRVS
jgi:hypothetical protein